MARPALSATRALEILDLFAAFPGRSFSMSEIMRATDINVASCHAILAALNDAGYLVRDKRDYRLGRTPIALGRSALSSQPLVEIAQQAAQALNAELGVEVLLSTVVAGTDILALTALPGASGAPVAMHNGQRMPLIPPAGAHFVAWARDEAIDRWIARAGEQSAEQVAAWRHALALTRSRGYQVTLRAAPTAGFAALMADMAAGSPPLDYYAQASRMIAQHGWTLMQPETIEADQRYDVVLIAAPIFDRDGNPILSLGLGGFEEAITGAQIEALAGTLLRACMQVMTEERSR